MNPRIVKMWEHKGWGDAISWLNFDDRSITGHMMPKPQVGDLVHSMMSSGRIAEFRVTRIDHCQGVHDQFIGKVEDVGYVT